MKLPKHKIEIYQQNYDYKVACVTYKEYLFGLIKIPVRRWLFNSEAQRVAFFTKTHRGATKFPDIDEAKFKLTVEAVLSIEERDKIFHKQAKAEQKKLDKLNRQNEVPLIKIKDL